jgi:hypothetical protein
MALRPKAGVRFCAFNYPKRSFVESLQDRIRPFISVKAFHDLGDADARRERASGLNGGGPVRAVLRFTVI